MSKGTRQSSTPPRGRAPVAEVDASIRLIDQIYDDAADAAMKEDNPPSAAARRLSAWARSLADPRAGDVSDGRPLAPLEDPTTVDTARIAVMERGPLVQLVMQLSALDGRATMPAFEALTEDELRGLARRLRTTVRVARTGDRGTP